MRLEDAVKELVRKFSHCSTGMKVLLFLVILLSSIALALFLVPKDRDIGGEKEAGFMGFRSYSPGESLTLELAARNLKYFATLSSVCHATGNQDVQAAYSFLFNQATRYINSGKWSFRQVVDAIQAARSKPLEIDTALACSRDSDNYHGLDLDQELRLRTLALNYRFYEDKIPVCKKAGNKVDTRVYQQLADQEHRLLYSGRYSPEEITGALAAVETSPYRQRIHGCH